MSYKRPIDRRRSRERETSRQAEKARTTRDAEALAGSLAAFDAEQRAAEQRASDCGGRRAGGAADAGGAPPPRAADGTPRVVCRYPFSAWTCSHCAREFTDQAPPRARMGLVCRECLDAGMGMGEPFVALTIKPRHLIKREDTRPVIAVSMADEHALTEDDELLTLPQLVERLRERAPGRPMTNAWQDAPQLPAAIIVTDSGTDLLGYLNQQEELTSSEFWQWKVSLRDHSPWRPEAPRRDRVFTRECVDLFGFASKRGDARRAGGRARYYQVLDPQYFSESARSMFNKTGLQGLSELRAFGVDVREFCNEHGLRMASTAAGIASQLLRDPEFWPRWRRKVPAATNKRAREGLPGNHYQFVEASELDPPRDAHKLDMTAAHHSIAMGCEFPSSDLLRAHGAFKRAPADGDAYEPADLGQPGVVTRSRVLLGETGMFCLALNVRAKLADDPLALPCLRAAGRHYRYVFSPELPTILQAERRGLVRIESVHAAWCSPETDEGLNAYAWWARRELERGGAYRRRWLKGALLAAYGLLASRPRRHRSAWAWANSDEEVVITTRYGDLFGVERATKRERESPTANVIWRGIIESALRARMLEEAARMRDAGHRVLSIYADAIFTTGDRPESAILRYEGVRHDLRFYGGATHYTSREEERLPGIRRGVKNRIELMKTACRVTIGARDGGTQRAKAGAVEHDHQVRAAAKGT